MIIVTGATGKLGRHVVEGLLKKAPADQLAIAVRSRRKRQILRRGVSRCDVPITISPRQSRPHSQMRKRCC